MRQPKALYILFFTELWERFGFYTLQTILILYMSKALLYSDKNAYLLYGTFSSMLYLFPVVGGYVADRYIGYRRAIILGAILFIIGYVTIAVPKIVFFYLGLGIIVLGNSFFKPNVSSIVGELYHQEDPRREGGFTIFYMGINLGALFPPLFAGAVVSYWGWQWGFLIAAMGLLIGLTTFLSGRKFLGGSGSLPERSRLRKNGKSFYLLLILGVLAGIAIIPWIFLFPQEANYLLIVVTICIIATVFYFLSKEHKVQRNKMIACLILIVISMGFWSIYVQTFTSLMLFADRNMIKHFLGFTIDAEFTQFFNPFFIIALSPVLSKFWLFLESKKQNPTIPLKFSYGISMMAIGYFLLAICSKYFSHDGMASPWWLVMSYFLQTIGELFISPIGLAMITRLVPKHMMGLMMGVWFLTLSASFAIGGKLATLASIPKHASLVEAVAIYSHAFLVFSLFSAALAVVSYCLVPFLNKLIRGDLPESTIKGP